MGTTIINDKSYHVDDKLIKLWTKNSLNKMNKKNADRVYIVDGRERSGKSTWAIQQMGFLNPSAFKTPESFVSKIVFTAEQFHETVRNTTNGVIIFDEAFRGFSSRAALSKVNKLLIQTLMEMGQNNNIVFIVLPSFFMLDMYPAMLRSDGLYHISEDSKTNLRKFEGYNRKDKNKIYQIGARKGWGYGVKSKFRGRFGGKFPGGKEYQQAYLDKKKATFEHLGDNPEKAEETKGDLRLNTAIYNLKEKEGWTFQRVADFFGVAIGTAHERHKKHRKVLENEAIFAFHASKNNNIDEIKKNIGAASP
jgi:hypothetical protein